MKYASLAPIVQIDAMGAPLPLISRKIAETAHEFFRMTRAYFVIASQDSVLAGQKNLTLKCPTGTQFIEVEWVRLRGKRLTLAHPEEATSSWEDLTGRPREYFVESKSVRLIPYPIEVVPELLKARFSVTPLITADQVADDIGQEHQDALILGAKAKLLSMSTKPWASAPEAAIAQAEYTSRINEVKLRVRKDGSSETNTVIKSRFV